MERFISGWSGAALFCLKALKPQHFGHFEPCWAGVAQVGKSFLRRIVPCQRLDRT